MDRSGAVRVGFAGAGGFATGVMAPVVHAASGVVLQAVAARDVGRARALEPAGAVYDSYEELLADPDVDLVYVPLSNDLHRPIAEAALRAGKDVLCEKPIGLDPTEVSSMHAVAAATGRLLVEGFWYRWHPRQVALEALVAAGALGEVRSVDAGFVFDGSLVGNYRLDAGRGGGALYDVGCYAVSAAVAALGNLAPTMAQVSEVRFESGVDVHTEALLGFDGGAVARVVGGFTGPESRWTTVVGSAARVALSEPAFSNAPEPAGGTSWVLERLGDDGQVLEVAEQRFAPADPRRAMVEGVAAVVRGDADAGSLPVTAAHSLAVSDAIALVLDEVANERAW